MKKKKAAKKTKKTARKKPSEKKKGTKRGTAIPPTESPEKAEWRPTFNADAYDIERLLREQIQVLRVRRNTAMHIANAAEDPKRLTSACLSEPPDEPERRYAKKVLPFIETRIDALLQLHVTYRNLVQEGKWQNWIAASFEVRVAKDAVEKFNEEVALAK